VVALLRLRSVVALALAWLGGAGPVTGRQTPEICGTYPDRVKVELALHRKAERLRSRGARAIGRHSAGTSSAPRPASRDVGDIAVLEGSPEIVVRPNPFDLAGQTLRFQPVSAGATQYRFELTAGGYDAAVASAGHTIELFADDDTRLINLPFAFPFFGASYTSLYVNSDGNLTFGRPDTETSPRSLGRAVSGPPRIAPLFADLDPSRAQGGVSVFLAVDRVAVSWVRVPEYRESGTGPFQTFQVRLYPTGLVEFAYQEVSVSGAVVGMAPGGRKGGTEVVSFSAGSGGPYGGAVMERFGQEQEIDLVGAAQAFYQSHEDAYDYLVIFNDLNLPASSGAVAFQITVRNHRTGTGQDVIDVGAEFGSPRRLQAILNMGPLSQYPQDPYAIVPARAISRDTPLSVLAHEAGHLFLAYVSVRDPQAPSNRPMLGRQEAHWSFNFNSDASFLEGNRICDRQLTPASCPSTASTRRFITTATVERFSELDQYLMGLRAPEEVSPTFLVANSGISPARAPQPGVELDGNRRDIRIEEVLQEAGPRIPDYTVEQRHYRFAFILITPEGQEPRPEAIEKLDRFRQAFEDFFFRATDGRAWAETSLRRALHLSMFPAAAVVKGQTAVAYVSLDQPAPRDLIVRLSPTQGFIEVPHEVLLPRGSRAVSFTVSGREVGVDELIAQVPESEYAVGRCRVRIRELAELTIAPVPDSATSVRTLGPFLFQLTGPASLVSFRVADSNRLSSPGLPVLLEFGPEAQRSRLLNYVDSFGEIRFHFSQPLPAGTILSLALAPPSARNPMEALPVTASAAIVNAASFRPVLSPGSLATLFGVHLAAGRAAAASGFPLPVRLADVEVYLNGRPVPLLYASDTQINFLVPDDTPTGTGQLQILSAYGPSELVPVEIHHVGPGIFTIPQFEVGAVVVAGTGRVTAERPARPGEWIEIYCTGLGPLVPDQSLGLFRTQLVPEVRINGQPAAIAFSGAAPGYQGLYQVNAQVPQDTPSGLVPLQLVVGGTASNEVWIRVER